MDLTFLRTVFSLKFCIYCLESKGFQFFVVFTLGYLGAQRFLLPHFYAYACVPIFIIALLLRERQRPQSNALVIFSLFLSVDNGGEVYGITGAIIRYSIYICLTYLFFSSTLDVRRLLIVTALIALPVFLTFLLSYSINFQTLYRDGILLLLLLSFSFIHKDNFSIQIHLLVFGIIGYIIADFLNFILIFRTISDDYLSYNSTKALIVLPFFYFLVEKRKIWAFLIFIITNVVLIAYGTRMLFLSFLVAAALGIITTKSLSLKFIVIIVLIGLVTIQILSSFNFIPESLKATGVIVQLLSDGDFQDKLRLIDPTRYTEHFLFFNRQWFDILFGSGLGSGLSDPTNEFYFVGVDATAFSVEELSSRYFYNLHDTWIDLGLRFGLLLVGLFYFLILRSVFSDRGICKLIGLVLFVLFTCTTYTTSGLLLIAAFSKIIYGISNESSSLKASYHINS